MYNAGQHGRNYRDRRDRLVFDCSDGKHYAGSFPSETTIKAGALPRNRARTIQPGVSRGYVLICCHPVRCSFMSDQRRKPLKTAIQKFDVRDEGPEVRILFLRPSSSAYAHQRFRITGCLPPRNGKSCEPSCFIMSACLASSRAFFGIVGTRIRQAFRVRQQCDPVLSREAFGLALTRRQR
jgi:hypothetical protein